MRDTLTIYKVFLIGYMVLGIFILGCEVEEQREPPAENPVDRQRAETQKSVDRQRKPVKSVPSTDTERTNTLSKKEIDKATEIKTWLKKKGYTVTPYSLSDKNGSTGMALGFGSTVNVNEVTLLNIKNNKVQLSVQNIGTAIFIIDANGELQPVQ